MDTTPLLHSWLHITFGSTKGWRWAALDTSSGIFEWGEAKGKPEDRLDLRGCFVEKTADQPKSLEVKTSKGDLILKWSTVDERNVWERELESATTNASPNDGAKGLERQKSIDKREPPKPPPKPTNLAANGSEDTIVGRASEGRTFLAPAAPSADPLPKPRRPVPVLPAKFPQPPPSSPPVTLSLTIDTVPDPASDPSNNEETPSSVTVLSPVSVRPSRPPPPLPLPVLTQPSTATASDTAPPLPPRSPNSALANKAPDEIVLLSGIALKPITPPPPEEEEEEEGFSFGKELRRLSHTANEIYTRMRTPSPSPPSAAENNSAEDEPVTETYLKYVGRTVRVGAPHKAGKASELTIEKGEHVTILAVTETNWAKGASSETGNMGWFPLVCLNYTGDDGGSADEGEKKQESGN